MNAYPWTMFFILLAAGLLASVAVLPYALSFNANALDKVKASAEASAGKKRQPPMPVLIAIGVLQNVLLFALATFLGLLTANKVGLELPILQAVLDGQPVGAMLIAMLPAVLLLGVFSGVALLGLEWGYFAPRLPRALANLDHSTAIWKRVLACFYGGIGEEILLRLFLMSALAWLLGLVWQSLSGAPAAGAFWLANILAALLFGAGHLPATRLVAKLSPIVVFRALLLNGIPGVAFGYLYMRYGLEAAMLAHFSLDLLVHLAAPAVSQHLSLADRAGTIAQSA